MGKSIILPSLKPSISGVNSLLVSGRVFWYLRSILHLKRFICYGTTSSQMMILLFPFIWIYGYGFFPKVYGRNPKALLLFNFSIQKKITRSNNWCRITHPKLNMDPQNQRLWKKRFRTLKPGSMLVFGGVFHDILTVDKTRWFHKIRRFIMEPTIFPLHLFFLNLARKRFLEKSHDPSVMHLHGENLQVWIPLEIRAKVDELLIRGRESWFVTSKMSRERLYR